MTDIRFYHLTRSTVDEALPQIVLKALSRDMRILVHTCDEGRVEDISAKLWSFSKNDFLPHGTSVNDEQGVDAAYQPIWVTHTGENKNEASLLMLSDGVKNEDPSGYDMMCYFFDGTNDMAVQDARDYWKTLKDKGLDLTYWQQDDRGSWAQKA